jgi:hypothetical protein
MVNGRIAAAPDDVHRIAMKFHDPGDEDRS